MKTILLKKNWPIILIITIGILLRVYSFPYNPPGLHQDEVSAIYEAYSLLLTGKDRWGNPWPIYFPGWGSGQNVLYSYLSIPFIYLFGLNIITTRLVSLILGILTLPLLYCTVKNIFNREIALISTVLLAILPWHLSISRWAVESNILPFFLILGIYTVSLALNDQASPNRIFLAFVPWSFGLYAYATSYAVIPLLIILVVLFNKDIVKLNYYRWLIAIIIWLTLSLPIILFIIKNFLIHEDFNFEKNLPFFIPLLPVNRLDQVSNTSFKNLLYKNIIFVLNGFADARSEFLPLQGIEFPFLVIGLFLLIRQFFILGKNNIFLLWLLSCTPLIMIAKLGTIRANAMYIPVIVISSFGFLEIAKSISINYIKRIFIISISTLIIIKSLIFNYYYFKIYPYRKGTAYTYQTEIQKAILKAKQAAENNEKILISQSVPLRYLYILFFLKVNPKEIQKNAPYPFNGYNYIVSNIGHFYFYIESLKLQDKESFIYVLKKEENICTSPETIYQNRWWTVGRCQKIPILKIKR